MTDSASDLPADLAESWNITVVPCYVVLGDRSLRDGVDISADEFYSRLTSEARLPTTAQPTAADFQAVYEELLGQGHQVVSIHISGKLSGTLNSAHQAREALSGGAAANVEIVDSLLASIPLGLVAMSAAERAKQAESHQEVAEAARRDASVTNGFFVVDTLEYLQKGGRIGRAQAFLGSVLNVKPILSIQDGEAHPLERVRNLDRAVRRLAALAHEMAPLNRAAVIYSTDPEQAETLRGALSDLMDTNAIVVARFGPTLGTYLGPKAVGVAVSGRRADDILNL